MPDIRPDNNNQVSLGGAPGGGLRAQDFSQGQAAQAAAGFGGQLSSAADDLQLVQEVHDEAAIKEVDADALRQLTEARREVLSLKGRDAVTGGDQFREKSAKIREAALARLTNERQTRLFTEVFDRRNIGDIDTVEKYATAETNTYMVNASNARLDALVDEAVDKYDDIEESAKLRQSIFTEIDTVGRMRGDGEDVIALAKRRVVSELHTNVVDSIEDPLAKEEYITKNAEELLPKDENALRQSNRAASDEARADTRFGSVLADYQGVSDPKGDVDPDKLPTEAREPDPEAVKRRAQTNADPLRGRGAATPQGGDFQSQRKGGRQHQAKDIPAAQGTPVFAPTYGEVIEVDNEGKTAAGYFVKVRHPDGRVTSYSHLRSVNVEKGQEVFADTALGGVGGTGVGGKTQYGSHLHFVVRDAKGRRVDPDKQKWEHNGEGFPSDGQYRPKYDGTRANVGELYEIARVRSIEEQWSPTETRAVMARIDEYASRQDKVQDREYDAQAEAASEVYTGIIENGGVLTNPAKQIPNFGKLDADTRRRYLEKAEANKAEIEAREQARQDRAREEVRNSSAGIDRYTDLYEFAHDPAREKEFADINLETQRPFMTDAEYKDLVKRQKFIQNRGGDSPELQATDNQVNSALNIVFPELGIDRKRLKQQDTEDRKRWVHIHSEATRLTNAEQEKLGRKLTDQEMQERVIKPLLQDVYVWEDNWIARDGYDNDEPISLVEARRRNKAGEKLDFIPAAAYRQIVNALRKKDPFGTVTEDMVRDVYNQRRK